MIKSQKQEELKRLVIKNVTFIFLNFFCPSFFALKHNRANNSVDDIFSLYICSIAISLFRFSVIYNLPILNVSCSVVEDEFDQHYRN